MLQRPPISTRTDTLVPYTTRFRSPSPCFPLALGLDGQRHDRPRLSPPPLRPRGGGVCPGGAVAPVVVPVIRSEEHTSELQSLMRISYAVFCSKNKIHRQSIKLQSFNYSLISVNQFHYHTTDT